MKHENALGLAAPAGLPQPNVGGARWTNELGSWVQFVVNGTGLSGHYHSVVGLNGGPVDSDDLAGYMSGELIAFTVRWPDSAITAWVGRYEVKNGVETIETLWQMTVMNQSANGAYWDSILAGSDTFTR
jgi:hypothetical protein